jgi:hypothetical protein
MTFWTKRLSRQLIALTMISLILVLGSALTVNAASRDRYPASDVEAAAQGDPTSTATLVVPVEGAEQAVMESTENATPTTTITPPTPTDTPSVMCTPPACKAGEVYYCAGSCPGGCGTQCATPTPIPTSNVIINGGFEEGFVEGQGMGAGWDRFQNGNVRAGWYDDSWSKVVYEGEHAQLLELIDASEGNRYVGIFQTVSVVPDAEYALTLHGLVRSDEGSPEASNYGYRMQYGVDFNGGTNWESEDIEWVELMWDDQPREDLTGQNVYRMEVYTTTLTTKGPSLTLFIRGWKKWADSREGNFDIDGVSLVGPQSPSDMQPDDDQATETPEPGMPETGNEFALLENSVLVVASAVLLVILAGGAVWGLARRRP